MVERPAVNASPLIFLARTELLDLLQLAAGRLVVPVAVATELRRRGPSDVAVRALEAVPWLEVVESPDISPVIRGWDLGDGESSVLQWAHAHPGTEAIVDDLAARRCAASLGIPVRGTLGLVLLARKRGRIELARPVLESLRQSGMYLSDDVMTRALRLVGE